MTPDTKSTAGPDHEPSERLSRVEFARKMRHEAYQRAKEYRKTDPRQIAMREKLKELRRETYQRVKEQRKAYVAEREKASKEKSSIARDVEQKKRMAGLVPGSSLKPVPKRHTPNGTT